jgi:hypothetical protein
MNVEVHAPSLIALVVSLALAVLGLVYGYFFAPAGTMNPAFWMAIMAYVVAAGGAMVKT